MNDPGDVEFVNAKCADNLLAGLEFEQSNEMAQGYARITSALVIGRSANADAMTMQASSRGVIGPRTENFIGKNISFYNFDVNQMAALGSCSHCYFDATTDSGGRTTSWSGLYFDPATVPRKIRYQIPYRDIFFDVDGSLTGMGPGSWATPYFLHNDQPECAYLADAYDGLICDSSIQLRRIVFYNYYPAYFAGQPLKILKWDDSLLSAMSPTAISAYVNDTASYSIVGYRACMNPYNAWAFPIMTGKKYLLHWGEGLDFTSMQMDLSPLWAPSDRDVTLVFNFTDLRSAVTFKTGGDLIPNGTYWSPLPSDHQTGANALYNSTATRQLLALVNGKNASRTSTVLTGYRCIGACLDSLATVPISNTTMLWSVGANWPSGKVPQAGEDVTVNPGDNWVFDLPSSPVYNNVQINGLVTFAPDAPVLGLNAKTIFVRSGSLVIGT